MFKCFKDKEFLNSFLKISIPVILSSFVTFFVNLLDNIMVGTVSNIAVSSVYAANQVTYLFNMASFGILEGAGIFIQQYNGTKDNKHIRQCFNYKIVITTILLAISIPLIIFFGKDMIYAFCNKDVNSNLILDEGTAYLNIIVIGLIPFAFSMILNTSLKEIGETKIPLYSSLVALFSNLIFNYLFIFILNMGTVGAAIATDISRIIELIFTIILTFKKKISFLSKEFGSIKAEKVLIISINKKSIPLFLNEMGYAIGMMLQQMAFSQRDSVLSSISICSTISQIIIAFTNGFAVGVGVLIGSRLGNDEFDKAKDTNNNLMFLGLYISLALSLIISSFSSLIPNMFSQVSDSQKELATYLLIIYSVVLPFQFLSIIVYYTLRAGGRSLDTLIFDSGTMVLFYIPIAWILALLTDIPMVYLFLIVRSLDIPKFILGLVLVKKNKWVSNITIKNSE